MPHVGAPSAPETDQTPDHPLSSVAGSDTSDAGWEVESGSVPFDRPGDEASMGLAGKEDITGGEKPPAKTKATAPAATAPEDTPDTEIAQGGTKGETRGERRARTKAARYSEHEAQLRDSQRKLQEQERRNRELETRLATLEQGSRPAPALPAAPAKPAAPADVFPTPPKYSDFDTDEAYQAAYQTWQTQTLPEWQARHDQALKGEITASLDTRLKTEETQRRQVAARTAAAERFNGRMATLVERHPDFPDRFAAVRETHGDLLQQVSAEAAPFLFDVLHTADNGVELLNDFLEDPELAGLLADLPLPTRALRDAVVMSPAAREIMLHFATDEGAREYERLRRLHPIRAQAAIGILEASLRAADRGSAPAAHSITKVTPPARPPVGAPNARGPAAPPGEESLESFVDRKERERINRRLRDAGLQPKSA